MLWLHDTTGGNSVQSSSFVPGTGWQQVTLNFTADNTNMMRIHLYFAAGSGTIYYDDVQVQMLNPVGDTSITTHKFTEDERDSESNLDHTQFRKYSSSLGRWIHPDPGGLAAVDPSNPQSWNRYAYVLNGPMTYTDPLGLVCSADAGGRDTPCNPGNSGGGGGSGSFGGYGTFGLMGIPVTAGPQYGWSLTGMVPGPSMSEYISNTPGLLDGMYSVTSAIGIVSWGLVPGTVIGNGFDLVGSGVGLGGGGGNSSGGPQKPKVSAQPTLKFKPPSWHNFTHEFLPCYGGQLLGNFLGDEDRGGTTAAAVALAVTVPKLGGPLLVLWTGLNAFKAGSECAVASRAVYQ